MKFFTPDLILRLNSSDGDVVDAATEEWEDRIVKYQKHIESIRRKHAGIDIPFSTLSLHDWQIVGAGPLSSGGWFPLLAPKGSKEHSFQVFEQLPRIFYIALQNGDERLLLLYVLYAEPSAIKTKEWPFSKNSVHWLYDEVDEAERHLVHSILLSNGQVMTIPFVRCLILPSNASESSTTPNLLQTA